MDLGRPAERAALGPDTEFSLLLDTYEILGNFWDVSKIFFQPQMPRLAFMPPPPPYDKNTFLYFQ